MHDKLPLEEPVYEFDDYLENCKSSNHDRELDPDVLGKLRNSLAKRAISFVHIVRIGLFFS